MEKLFELLRSKLHWLLLFLCEIIALLLLFHGSFFHSFIGAAASSAVVGHFNERMARIRSYLALQEENEALLTQLVEMESRYLSLKRQIDYLRADTVDPRIVVMPDSLRTSADSLSFITAEVVSMTHHKANNLITINRGAIHGVKPNMGVASQQGVVGVVSKVGSRYATVVPIINEDMSLSCKTKGEGFIGNLGWQHNDAEGEAFVSNLPKHATFRAGDTIVTSGYSAIFPAGVMVGCLQGKPGSILKQHSSLPVSLSTDFSRLHYVYVIISSGHIPEILSMTDSLP